MLVQRTDEDDKRMFSPNSNVQSSSSLDTSDCVTSNVPISTKVAKQRLRHRVCRRSLVFLRLSFPFLSFPLPILDFLERIKFDGGHLLLLSLRASDLTGESLFHFIAHKTRLGTFDERLEEQLLRSDDRRRRRRRQTFESLFQLVQSSVQSR